MNEHIETAWAKSENYIFHWRDMPDDERFTQDEATAIWWEIHQIINASGHPEARIVYTLALKLERERTLGGRCSVCARWRHPDCALNC